MFFHVFVLKGLCSGYRGCTPHGLHLFRGPVLRFSGSTMLRFDNFSQFFNGVFFFAGQEQEPFGGSLYGCGVADFFSDFNWYTDSAFGIYSYVYLLG